MQLTDMNPGDIVYASTPIHNDGTVPALCGIYQQIFFYSFGNRGFGDFAMRRSVYAFAALAILWGTTTSTTAHSINLGFLHEAPISRMTDEDIRIYEEAVRRTLEEQPDGQPTRWENPSTGASGVVTPLRTHQAHGTTCRVLRSETSAGNRTGETTFELCKQPDGSWKAQQK